jgi:serine/tyrosine/threonine adenylyltransferase
MIPAPRFLDLGAGFSDEVRPAAFPAHVLRFRNQRWAERVGLGGLDAAAWERCFASFEPLAGNLPRPLALRYHGHQFGVYNPRLGDGRGFLYAQLRDLEDGRLLDLGTKGSGETPWSRGGDGRLTLKGGVREVLAAEMLEALGVVTSKAFSLFETGERLFRGDEPSPTRSSVLVRLSHSHLRFGTFQRLAHLGDEARLRRLFDFAVEHYVPHLAREGGDPVLAFVREVCRRSATLCASFMVAGFAHGVLNTDNLTITGEAFDFGPYRFVPTYDPEFVAAYFDETGLYAFGRQPRAFVWSLTHLCDALRPLSPTTAFAPALREFEPTFVRARARGLCRRLGIAPSGDPDVDQALAEACFAFLEDSQAGYDRFFFDWFGGLASEERAKASPAAGAYEGPQFDALRRLLDLFAPAAPEALGKAYFAGEGPVTLLIGEVEALWAAIAERDDWSLFTKKVEAIRDLGALCSGNDRDGGEEARRTMEPSS